MPRLTLPFLLESGRSALPGGVSVALRAFFNIPSWAFALLVVAGLGAAATLAVLAWRTRGRWIPWFRLRWTRRAWRTGFLAAAGLTGIVAAGAGVAGQQYMEHANAFCVSCHVMTPAWQKFASSEHKGLECHDCHHQSLYANARQFVLWWIERPSEIGPHHKVPGAKCMECHREEREWRGATAKAIATSSGHVAHLRLDNPKLRDITCISCHSTKTHEFKAGKESCRNAGCHDELQVKIDTMRAAAIACTTCHDFGREDRSGRTVAVAPGEGEHASSTEATPVLVSAAGAQREPALATHPLSPQRADCLGCHAMQERIGSHMPEDEPHHAECGACHNPHEQSNGKGASATCRNSGCHDRVEQQASLHRGLPTARLNDCLGCHPVHTFRVDGKNCRSCHATIADRAAQGGSVALRLASTGFSPAANGFTHARHRDVECAECHSSSDGHGTLRITRAGDCQGCHHAKASASDCRSCHSRDLASSRAVKVSVAFQLPKGRAETRSLSFDHSLHREVECSTCHDGGAKPRADCESCHASHHERDTQCSSCHAQPKRAAHPAEVHEGCAGSGCHAAGALAELPAGRNGCLLCHRDQAKHNPRRECTSCHVMRSQRAATQGTVPGAKARPARGGVR